MTDLIQEILVSDIKHKEKVALITDNIISDKNLLAQLFELLKLVPMLKGELPQK